MSQSPLAALNAFGLFAAGQPPVYGQQIVYFADAVLGARGALQAPSKRDAAPESTLSFEEERMAKELLRSG